MQSLAEGLGPDVVLQHAEDGAALAVADGIEQLAYLGGVIHVGFDGVGVAQTVQPERGVRVVGDELRPHLPLRIEVVDRLVAHPRCERLVEPEVVPPLHRHEVAEPHVRHLVRDDFQYPLLRLRRGVLRVVEQCGLAVGDRAPVLHRARCEVRHGDMVHLRQGIRDAEVVVHVAERGDAVLQREAAQLLLTPRCPDPHERAVLRVAFDARHVAHDEREQVGGHRGRTLERDGLASSRGRLGGSDGHVGDGLQLLRHDERDVERCLHLGFVPAGERTTGVRCLELRRRETTLDAVAVHVGAAVEAAQLVVQLAGEVEAQHHAPRRKRRREAQRHALLFLVVLNRARL